MTKNRAWEPKMCILYPGHLSYVHTMYTQTPDKFWEQAKSSKITKIDMFCKRDYSNRLLRVTKWSKMCKNSEKHQKWQKSPTDKSLFWKYVFLSVPHRLMTCSCIQMLVMFGQKCSYYTVFLYAKSVPVMPQPVVKMVKNRQKGPRAAADIRGQLLLRVLHLVHNPFGPFLTKIDIFTLFLPHFWPLFEGFGLYPMVEHPFSLCMQTRTKIDQNWQKSPKIEKFVFFGHVVYRTVQIRWTAVFKNRDFLICPIPNFHFPNQNAKKWQFSYFRQMWEKWCFFEGPDVWAPI